MKNPTDIMKQAAQRAANEEAEALRKLMLPEHYEVMEYTIDEAYELAEERVILTAEQSAY